MSSALSDYVPILVLVGLSTLLAVVLMGLTFVIGPRNPSPEKSMPYECGIQEIEPGRQRFPVKFLLVAMLFLVFDVESVSFYPWAVMLHELKVFGLVEMLLFMAILLLCYIYVWRKGAFQWEE